MNRIPFLAGNWKMHKTVPEAADLANTLARSLPGGNGREVMVAPPFTALSAVHLALQGSEIRLGAQNMHPDNSGAFTGEVSAGMLISTGCTHVIIGHSERRHVFGETDSFINRKVIQALLKGLHPILCVGETLDERESGAAKTVVQTQLHEGLKNLTRDDLSRIIVAYEPVWAIGTGKTATPDQAQEMHGFIRELIATGFEQEIAGKIRILYGGSVKPANISELMVQADIDGALVGGASLNAEDFLQIVNYR